MKKLLYILITFGLLTSAGFVLAGNITNKTPSNTNSLNSARVGWWTKRCFYAKISVYKLV